MPDERSAAPAFPAPGSAVPGAPPRLKRQLTAVDGVATPVEDARGATAVGSLGVPGPVSGRSRFTVAAAMIGVAVGLELAGLLFRSAAHHNGSKY